MSQDYPHNHEAERAVLGAVLVDNEHLDTVRGLIEPAHFHLQANQVIWSALLRLAEKGTALDLVTLSEELLRAGEMDAAHGQAYVASLIDGVPRSLNVVHYAGIVRELALRRYLIRQGDRLMREAREADDGAAAVLDGTIASLVALSGQATPGDLVEGSRLASEAMAWLDEVTKRRSDRRVSGVPSGFYDLDEMTDGFQPGNLVILAARPSQGKSAMALQLALQADGPCAFFSLEMGRGELSARALATLARVDGWAMRRGYLADTETKRVVGALERLAESGIAIDESPSLTVAQLRSKARRWQMTRGLRMVICDYLQLMTPVMKGKREANREQEVAGMTRGLKAVARDLQVPLIALAQLNRATDQQRDKQPTLANLRESGAVEQDADLVMFIHRPDGQSVAVEGDVQLIVAKNRTGPTGSVSLRWYPPSTRFESMQRQGAA